MIIRLSGLPLTTTSANKHGAPPPREAQEVLKQLGGEVDLLLDCGRITGRPSTIIDVTKTPPLMVRNGPVTREMIEEIVGSVEG
jgi:L-threonylcarbamoyladenylate synthase